MSKVGKLPIKIPSGIEVNFDGSFVTVKSTKGSLSLEVNKEVNINLDSDKLVISPSKNSIESKKFWGTFRSLINNMIKGLSDGFVKNLEINGVGYRANIQNNVLVLNLGYSHDVRYSIPKDIFIVCPEPTKISISGIDKQKVGQVASEIRAFKKPEPYKGKGIRYEGEFILHKEGKKK